LVFGLAVWGAFESIVRWQPHWFEYRDRATGTWRSLDLDRLRILAVASPLVVLQRMLGGLLQGLRDMRGYNACFLAQNLVLISGSLVLVLWLDWGVDGAIWAHVAGMGAGGGCALVLALRHPEVRQGPFGLRPRLMGGLILGGLRLHGGVVAAWIILVSDQLVVMRYRGQEETALYALAAGFTGHVRRLIVIPVKEVLGSRLPRLVADPERWVATIADSCRHTVLLVLIPGIGLATLGWLALWILYGPAAIPAYWPLLILVPGNLLWAAAVILSYWFVGQDRFLTLTVIGLFIAGSNVALNFAFVPEHGMVAAAATSTFCYSLHLILFLIFIRLRSRVSPRRFLIPRRSDLTIYGDTWRALRRRFRGSR
jgi:O-antigen/teichoic acid export membrane protein